MGVVHFRKQSSRAVTVIEARDVIISPFGLPGILRIPPAAKALVVFSHSSGTSRLSPRNRAVSQALNEHGIATLLFDLLSEAEAEETKNMFDIGLLSDRLASAVEWIDTEAALQSFPLGLFGAGAGTAAALMIAARLRGRINAVVSRGGRPDLASEALASVSAPVLLIVGGEDRETIALNEGALAQLANPKAMEIVAGAGPLFREPGALTAVTVHAARWFEGHLMKSAAEQRSSAAAG